MNIKSLLLGSAAALAAVSGAQAADAIVAAEPEPMEYVRVCDAFGTGYFYIPGTETCLKIGGSVRFQVDLGQETTRGRGVFPVGGGIFIPKAGGAPDFVNAFGVRNNDDYWDARGRIQLGLEAKNDTELGTLTSVAKLNWNYGNNDGFGGSNDSVEIDEASIELGGFKVGRFGNFWDAGIAGEADGLNNVGKMNSVRYSFDGSSFSAGVQVDELSIAQELYSFSDELGEFGFPDLIETRGSQNFGIEALVGTKFGSVSLDVIGGYDFRVEEGAVRAIGKAAVGPGSLEAAVIWASGANAYYNAGEWTVAASYALQATDKLTLTPGAQYVWDTATTRSGEFFGPDLWRAGITADYKIVSGLDFKANVNYEDNVVGQHWGGFVRLERKF